jgi:hypothetical protein
MGRSLRRAASAGFVALLLAVSCSDTSEETGNAGAGGAAAGAGAGGVGAGSSSAGATDAGSSSAGATDAGSSGSGATDAGSSGGDTAGASGSGDVTDAGSDSGLNGGDASASAAADGEPCPNGDECGAGLICVGYGNPLPNGESTACRRVCSSESPPPDCSCSGAGFCENSVSGGSPDAGGGADAGLACGQVITNAGCADADGTTTDFQSGEFQGCLHWRDLGDGQGWIYYDTNGGFHYDLSTSLGWVVRTDTFSSQADAADFCANFSVAGLSDWRLPTIDEARSLAGGCDNTAPGGSCPLSDSGCLSSSCGIGPDCTSCVYGLGANLPGNGYCRADVMVCNDFHTSSSCPDCSTAGDWRYNPANGNFFASAAADAIFPVCVMDHIPRAVPCRN